MTRRLLASVLVPLLLAGVPLPGAGQECPHGRISHIFIDNHSIFDLTEMDEDTPLLWAYRLANTLHITTREGFIRSELLFEEGDCHDPLLLGESERILRDRRFIARVDVFAVPQPDDTHHVVVDTRDEWTTKVNLGLAFDEGVQLEGLSVTEENFLGRGALLGFFFRERRERRDLGFRMEAPRLLGTRWETAVSVGRTRVGSFFTQELAHPFVGEVGRLGARQRISRRESLFPYSVPGEGASHEYLLLPMQDDAVELSAAGRIGRPGSLSVLGAALIAERLRFEGYPDDLEVSPARDFSETRPAEQELAEQVSGQLRGRSATRLHLMVGQRNLRFEQRRGLDALDGIQDIRGGAEANLTVGRTLGGSRVSEHPIPDDLTTRLQLFAGGIDDTRVVSSTLNFQARRVLSGEDPGSEWRDVLAEFDTYLYWQPGGPGPGHTVFARLSAAGGWRMETPFQLTLGGRAHVRGFREEEFPGARRVLVSVEDRLFVDWPLPELFDLGFTFFADAGRIWAGDVPFGRTRSWKGTVGAGLRFGFPPGTRNLARVDVAVPLSARDGPGSPVFRIVMEEVIGLLPGIGDQQMVRSRRGSVGADLLTLRR